MSQESNFGISPEQYHAGLDKLWKALGITTVQDKDVFTLAAEKIQRLNRFVADSGTTCFSCEVCGHARTSRECLHCEIEMLRKRDEPRTCSTCKYWYENARRAVVVLDQNGCRCPKFSYGYGRREADSDGISVEDDEGWGCFPGPDFGCVHHNKRD